MHLHVFGTWDEQCDTTTVQLWDFLGDPRISFRSTHGQMLAARESRAEMGVNFVKYAQSRPVLRFCSAGSGRRFPESALFNLNSNHWCQPCRSAMPGMPPPRTASVSYACAGGLRVFMLVDVLLSRHVCRR